MKPQPVECEFEADVLCAVLQSRWPEQAEPALREHAAHCHICADVATVSSAIAVEADQSRMAVEVPDAGRVWWVAQRRARSEAAKTAGRPITAVQVLAFSAAMGIIGACFGATSEWLQGSLKWFRGFLAGVDIKSSVLAGHELMIIGIIAVVLIVPFAIALATAKDSRS